MTPQISDYAIIGNSRSAALVSKYGSIDWCCLPEFDSPSVFAALLDREKGGFFSIAPIENYKSIQSYIPDTNVVETYFTTEAGEARLLDAFTIMTEEEKAVSLFPDHEMIRVVEGISGTLPIKVEYTPGIYYAKFAPYLRNYKKLGIHFSWKEHTYVLLSTLEPEELKVINSTVLAEFNIKPGERIIFSMSYSNQSPAIIPELKTTAWKRMQQTIHLWRDWISKCQYTGLYKDQVRRSALVLKLLTHAPSGAIIAAPTTSLPERLGGGRNWDYRFCWLRDASFTTRVLLKLGFKEEAHAYMNWIHHATQLTRPKLQVVYSVFGHAKLIEKILSWLRGYKSSVPVRVGNKADSQFQLDVYGEVLDAVYTYAPLVKDFDRNTRKFILGLGEVICELWNQPDNGIWEVRSSPVHHTHSMAMAWVGLDRLIKLCQKFHWEKAPLEKFKHIAKLIRDEVERYGYNQELNSYTRELNGNTLDASLLTLSLFGYHDASSPRMVATTNLIYERLSWNNLVYRYQNVDDGLSGEEGSFAACTFWLVECLAKSGRIKKAIEVFEALLQHASPTGLLSEEIDPKSHELLGNYPQGFTHIDLINAVLTINEVYKKEG
jgi:GH15 family glucan-1,4-alpha-glucosidase